jgi:hypothetical protein
MWRQAEKVNISNIERFVPNDVLNVMCGGIHFVA